MQAEDACPEPREANTDEALGDNVRAVVRGPHLAEVDCSAAEPPSDHGVARGHPTRGLDEPLAAGAVEDDLPVFQILQDNARYIGFEVQGSATVARLGDSEIKLDALADYTDAKILGGGGAVPRIPPLRMLAGIGVTGPVWDARAEIEHATSQTRVAEFETETAAYTLVNASISIRPFADWPTTAIVVSANNIFDVDARRHASFLKNFAPLAGRDIRVSLRFTI